MKLKGLAAALSPLLAALLGCGSGNSTSAACTSTATLPPLPSAVPQAGTVAVTADRDQVAVGGAVAFTVTVAGPAQLSAPCAGPVQLNVTDQAGLHVFSSAPPAPKGIPCDAVTLATGQHVQYGITWQPDASLPPGPYLATFSAGDQPPVSVEVRVVSSLTPRVSSCS